MEFPLPHLTLYSRNNTSLHILETKLLNTTLDTFPEGRVPGPQGYLYNMAEFLHEGWHGADVEVVQAQGIAEGFAVLGQQICQQQGIVLLRPQQLHQLGSHCLHLLHLCQGENLLLPTLQDLQNTRDTRLRGLM